MDIKNTSVDEAQRLLDEDGYAYLDVRSEEEFEAGHVPGALNVPINIQGPSGMAPNPDFMKVMEQAFEKEEKLIVGCKAGGRAIRAATQLLQAGFSRILVMGAGFHGSRDGFGRPIPGWSQSGFPIEAGKPEGQAYDSVKQRRAGG